MHASLRLPGYKVLAQNTQVEREEGGGGGGGGGESNRQRNEPSRYVYSSRLCM